MEVLLLAMLAASVVTKWVQDGRTDRAYASRGMVSPRYQERLAKLEKAGRPNARTVATERGPFRQYLSELYADAMVDLTERHRAKRAIREPYDPTAPTLRQRFTAGVLAEIEEYKRKARWTQPPAEPVTEPAVAEPAPVDFEPGTVTFDEHGDRILVGAEGKRWCLQCVTGEMGVPIPEHLQSYVRSNETTGGTTMTGEAVNYETTVAAIDAAEQQVSTIAERLDGADAAVAELRASTEQVAAGMGALRLDDASTAGVNAALESLTPETFADIYARLDAARAGLANARENVIATYGDAAATVAATGVDESFLATA